MANPAPQRSTRLRDAFYGVWAIIGVCLLAVALWRVLAVPLRPLVPAVVIATLGTYLYSGPTRWLVSRGLRRAPAVLLLAVVSVGVLAGAAVLLFPVVARQSGTFIDALPDILANAQAWVNSLLVSAGVSTSIDLDLTKPAVTRDLADLLVGREGTLEGLFAVISGVAHRVVYLAIGLVAGPLAAIYILIDMPRLSAGVTGLLPSRHRDDIVALTRTASRNVGAYLRGQLVIAVFVGVASTAGMAAIGLPFWAIVGILAGVTNLVPLIGPLVGGAVGVTIALTAGNGLGQAVAVAVIMIVVQQVESHVLAPQIMSRTVSLRPLTVLVLLAAAAPLGGLLAMVTVIPLAATVKVVIGHLRSRRADAAPASTGDGAKAARLAQRSTAAPSETQHGAALAGDGDGRVHTVEQRSSDGAPSAHYSRADGLDDFRPSEPLGPAGRAATVGATHRQGSEPTMAKTISETPATAAQLDAVRAAVSGTAVRTVDLTADGIRVDSGRQTALLSPGLIENLWALRVNRLPASAGPFEQALSQLVRTVERW